MCLALHIIVSLYDESEMHKAHLTVVSSLTDIRQEMQQAFLATSTCNRMVTYLQAHGCTPLLNSFHCILYLVDSTLRAPCNHILIVLWHTAARDARSHAKHASFLERKRTWLRNMLARAQWMPDRGPPKRGAVQRWYKVQSNLLVMLLCLITQVLHFSTGC